MKNLSILFAFMASSSIAVCQNGNVSIGSNEASPTQVEAKQSTKVAAPLYSVTDAPSPERIGTPKPIMDNNGNIIKASNPVIDQSIFDKRNKKVTVEPKNIIK